MFAAGLVLLTLQAALLGTAARGGGGGSSGSGSGAAAASLLNSSKQQQQQHHSVLFTLSMVALALGTGGIKPNVSPCGKREREVLCF